jgi:hypothetical protein
MKQCSLARESIQQRGVKKHRLESPQNEGPLWFCTEVGHLAQTASLQRALVSE